MTNKHVNQIPLIGLLAVKNQLITQAELDIGLAQCAPSTHPEKELKEYLLSHKLVSVQNMERLSRAVKTLEFRQKEHHFGAIAIKKGFVNQSVLDLALAAQKEEIRVKRKLRLIGDLMVEAGFLTVKQRDYILKFQKRLHQAVQKTETLKETPLGQGPQKRQPEKPLGPEEEHQGSTDDLTEPEVIGQGIRLQVSRDSMSAFISKTEAFNPEVQVSQIKEALSEKGIVVGIVVDEMIGGFIRSSGFKTQAFRVANGIGPVQGEDAKLEFFFNTNYLKAGGMGSDGNIDFKQRGEIPLVEEGTVLAEKIPMKVPRQGQTIYGEVLEVSIGRDIPLRFGTGVKLSEDGLKLLADVRGYPKYALSGVIFVHDVFTTSGDVDYETGHVEYNGNVNIKGCVKSGFRVRGNDIRTIELDGGIVEADGDVVVAGGINQGKIYARGNVSAKFIQNSEIVCMGNVRVEKEIVDSHIESSGTCSIENGKIISSKIAAKMGVTARHIGTEMTAPNQIRVGQDLFTQKELEKNRIQSSELLANIQGFREKKEAFIKTNIDLQKQITQLAHIQDRSQIEQRQIQAKIPGITDGAALAELNRQLRQLQINARTAEKGLDQCFEKTETIEAELERIDGDIEGLTEKLDGLDLEKQNLIQWAQENPGKAVVVSEGEIQPDTHISGQFSELIVDQPLRRVKIMEVVSRETGSENRKIHEMQINNI